MAGIVASDLSMTFAGQTVLDGVDLSVEEGERLCIVGRNGSGKSTFLRIIAGDIDPDGGTVSDQAGVALLRQESGGSGTFGAADDGVDYRAIATRLGVDIDADLRTLSGGERRRRDLAAVLAADADTIILDEPTNHLDLDTVLWLEDHLVNARKRRTLLFVTHDRAFARAVATRVIEIDRGALLSYTGGYDDFIRRRDAWLETEATQEKKEDRLRRQEEEWLRRGTRARRTRDEGRVRALMEMRRQYEARRARAGSAGLGIAEAARSGDIVFAVENLSFGYGTTLFAGFSTQIERRDRVGIVGPNGAGKTSLLRLLLGTLEVTSGSVRRGASLEVAHFEQLRDGLDGKQTLFEAMGDGYDVIQVGGRKKHVSAYLQDFLFSPADAKKPVSVLSGGERNRFVLAKLFARPSNLLVLDEPTNDLDLETLELLEDRLLEYNGTILLVSHDREFLDNVVTDCIVLPGDGTSHEFAGGYSDWRELYQSEKGGAQTGSAAKPAKRSGSGAAGGGNHGDTRRARAPRTPRAGLSYREKEELAGLADRIETAEVRRDEFHALLADPSFYREQAERAAAVTRELEELEEEIVGLYERWEHLESRRGD